MNQNPAMSASDTPITDACVAFVFNGIKYRTNADASCVEGLDGKTWNQTFSLSVRDAALRAIASARPCPYPIGKADTVGKCVAVGNCGCIYGAALRHCEMTHD